MSDDATEKGIGRPEDEGTIVIGPKSGAKRHPSRTCLVALAGWEIGREIELSAIEYVIGRAPGASIQVTSMSISREHAKITRVEEETDPAFFITDLDSSNGTFVNNARIERQRLHSGDRIQLGEVTFRFVVGDETDARIYQNIHNLIYHDRLTGLLTMEAFRSRLDNEIRRGPDTFFSLVMTDLDGLKRINDTHGHLAGRMTVREMGVIIRQNVRSQDFAALYGGDETIMLFPVTHLKTALEIAERIRAAIESLKFTHAGHSFHVTISQGIAEWPRDGRTVEEIIGAADKALYAAKAAGRNCVRGVADLDRSDRSDRSD